MAGSTLDIKWRLGDPPLSPSSCHVWKKPPEHPQSRALETRLQWPRGTVAVLREAFALRLGRAVGWEDEKDAPAPSRVQAAARVFKRGVGYRQAGAGTFAESTSSGSYLVEIVDACTPAALAALLKSGRTKRFVVVDDDVAGLWQDVFKNTPHTALACSEHKKTLATVATLLEAAAAAGTPREWVLVGGGLLTDVAAFAASLVDASVTMVPTTLLAMADASVGGKTGVNFPPFGKNQVGTFHFPRRVLMATAWLKTLPERELLAGGAECLKHAFLTGDTALAARLAEALCKRDLAQIAQELPAVVRVKAEIVAEDPGEIARRATLNLGHTFGHALEGLSQANTSGATTLLHGEAVGIGLVVALAVSARVAGLGDGARKDMVGLLKLAGLVPTKAQLARRLGVRDLSDAGVWKKLEALTVHDKKNTEGAAATPWILLAAPGRVALGDGGRWTVPVAKDEMQAAWREVVAGLS